MTFDNMRQSDAAPAPSAPDCPPGDPPNLNLLPSKVSELSWQSSAGGSRESDCALGEVALRKTRSELEKRMEERTAGLRAINQKLEEKIERHAKIQEELRQKSERLERFHKLSVNRELNMVNLKKEVNDLLRELRRPIKYQAPDRLEKIKLAGLASAEAGKKTPKKI